jgi:hypothetical protein
MAEVRGVRNFVLARHRPVRIDIGRPLHLLAGEIDAQSLIAHPVGLHRCR